MGEYYFLNKNKEFELNEYTGSKFSAEEELKNNLPEGLCLKPYENQKDMFELTSDNPKFKKSYILLRNIIAGGREGAKSVTTDSAKEKARREWRIEPDGDRYQYLSKLKSSGKNAILLGVYSYNDILVFCSWGVKSSTTDNGSSQQVKIEVLNEAQKFGFTHTPGKNGYICAFTKELLPFFLLNSDWINDRPLEENSFNLSTFNIDYGSDTEVNNKLLNRIVFGAPGTSKSYGIKGSVKGFSEYERVTFHPNYSYSQFVGTYKPVAEEATISYEYVPGPFIRILEKAINPNNRDKKYLLIIEEINRANVAAVFGDMFQLLDRDKDGISEYAINLSEELKTYFLSRKDLQLEPFSDLRLPNNFYIWATMNSADQGVFPMDAAFKRRWNFEYLSIDDPDISEKCFVNGKLVKNLLNILNEDDPYKNYDFSEDSFSKLEKNEKTFGLPKEKFDLLNWRVEKKENPKEESDYYNWYTLRMAINSFLKNNVDWINEDKLLGPWFIKPDSEDKKTITADSFCNKVLMYLYEDVVKIQPDIIFAKGEGNQLFYSDIKNNWMCGNQTFKNEIIDKYNELTTAEEK